MSDKEINMTYSAFGHNCDGFFVGTCRDGIKRFTIEKCSKISQNL